MWEATIAASSMMLTMRRWRRSEAGVGDYTKVAWWVAAMGIVPTGPGRPIIIRSRGVGITCKWCMWRVAPVCPDHARQDKVGESCLPLEKSQWCCKSSCRWQNAHGAVAGEQLPVWVHVHKVRRRLVWLWCSGASCGKEEVVPCVQAGVRASGGRIAEPPELVPICMTQLKLPPTKWLHAHDIVHAELGPYQLGTVWIAPWLWPVHHI